MVISVNSQEAAFLSVANEDLSWEDILGSMQLFGKLRTFLQEVVSQHLIIQEVRSRTDLLVERSELEQAIIDYRLKEKLTEPGSFQEWLAKESIDYTMFQNRIFLQLKINKLKTKISETRLPEYFNERKHLFEKLDLSCLIIKDQELAQQLRNKLQSPEVSFEQIAQEYSTNENSTVNLTNGIVRRQLLPAQIRGSFESVEAEMIIGPLEIENRWGIFRVEKIIPAVLDESLSRQLEEQLFQLWLIEKISNSPVKLGSGVETE